MTNTRISKLTILGYGLGHVCNDICASMWFTYLLLFFQKVLGVSRSDSAVLMLIGQFADGISTTILGLIADKIGEITIFRKYGKRKSLHLFGSFCVFLSFPFIFLPTLGKLGSDSQMVYYSVFIVIFQFGWAGVQISHLALIPDLTNNENIRTMLTSVRYGFTVLSNLLVYVTTLVVFGTGESQQQVDHDDAESFRNIMLVGISCGLAATLSFHLIVREQSRNNDDEIALATKSDSPIVKNPSLVSWLLNPKLYFVACVYMATRLFVNLTQSYIPFYLQDSIHVNSTYLAVIPLIQYVTSFLCSFATNFSNRAAGRHLTWLGGAFFGCIVAILIQFMPDNPMRSFGIFFVAILVGASGCVFLITSLGLTADLIGDHVQSGALIYGLMSLTDKLSNGLAVVVIQDLIPCLPTFDIKFWQLMPDNISTSTTELPCTDYPVIITSTQQADTSNNPCYGFYQIVLAVATSSTSIFGAIFIILLFLMKYLSSKKDGKESRSENVMIKA